MTRKWKYYSKKNPNKFLSIGTVCTYQWTEGKRKGRTERSNTILVNILTEGRVDDQNNILVGKTTHSVQFSRSVVSDSLRSYELQHARPPCPSPTPGVHSTQVHRVSDAIQPSHPLSSPSPPAPNSSQHQSLFQ